MEVEEGRHRAGKSRLSYRGFYCQIFDLFAKYYNKIVVIRDNWYSV